MNYIKKIKNAKISTIVFVEIIIMVLFYLASSTIFNKLYLFEWFSHNYTFYLVLCFISLVPIILNKNIVSLFLTSGLIVGTFIGQFLGDILLVLTTNKINSSTSVEQVQYLSSHRGFYIWIIVTIISFVMGIFLDKKIEKIIINEIKWFIV